MNAKAVPMDFAQHVLKIGGENHPAVVHINAKMVNMCLLSLVQTS